MSNLKLDYSLTSPQERKELVDKILDETPQEQLNSKYLEILADYLVIPIEKEEKKKKEILTNNHMVTVNKRETSYQGMVDKLENGEDGLYNLMSEMGKNVLLVPKISITEKDIAEIPGLKELRKEIEHIRELEKAARGKRKYLLKKQLIEMCQDQYILKNSYRKTLQFQNPQRSFTQFNFDENLSVDADGNIASDGKINLMNPAHISALLRNYSAMKEDSWGNFTNDSWYIMEDLDNLIESALKEKFPLYYDLTVMKIEGASNAEIQKMLQEVHGITHSIEYLSSLWRKKIPKLLADKAQEDYLIWYYTNVEKGKWKRCSRCGEIKLAHSKFFTRNKSSKDGFYSICKCCRNKKK